MEKLKKVFSEEGYGRQTGTEGMKRQTVCSQSLLPFLKAKERKKFLVNVAWNP